MQHELFKRNAEGLSFALRVTPKAKRNHILGIMQDEKGDYLLKVAVTSVPEEGKANEAVIQLLCKLWHLRKNQIKIKQGLGSRNKVVQLFGTAAELWENVKI